MLRKIKANIPSGCAAIALMGLFLTAGIWSYTVSHIRDETVAAAASEVSKNENLVLAMEEQTIRVIRNIDQLLLIIKDQTQQTGSSDVLKRLIKAGIVDLDAYTFAGVTNAKGDVVASLLPTAPGNLADQDYFLRHKQDNADRLLISKPRVGRFTGRRVILFTRRITKPDGAFGGAVIIGIDPRVFSQLYEKPHLSPSTIISLIDEDGGILARRVALSSSPETHIRNQTILARIRNVSPTASA